MQSASEGSEALREDTVVPSRPATARQSIGRALAQVDGGGAGADDHVLVEGPVVPG
jgi:hypothetical protein